MNNLLLLVLALIVFYSAFRLGIHVTMVAIDRGAADRLTPQECHELDRLLTKATGKD